MPLIGKAALFGAAGAVGAAVGRELARKGIPFRAVGRSRERLEKTFAGVAGSEIVAADLSDAAGAAAAARGVDTIFYTLGLPYPQHHLHPRIMRSALDGAIGAQARRLVLVSNVYSYGVPNASRVPETHPRHPQSRKGQYRKEQEDMVLEAQKRGQIDGMVVRLPDFYGPGAEASLANPIFRAALEGKKANWIGPVNTPHEFVFVPDTGPVLVELASCAECYGEAWNFGGPGAINTLDFITKVYRAAGRPPKYRTAGRGLLKVIGWFNPLFKELPEMLYLQETPVILDDSKLAAKFPNTQKTSYDDGVRQTLEWMRNH